MPKVGKNIEMKRALKEDIAKTFCLMLKALNKKHKVMGPEYIRDQMLIWLTQHNSDRTAKTFAQREKRKMNAKKLQDEVNSLKTSINSKNYLDGLQEDY